MKRDLSARKKIGGPLKKAGRKPGTGAPLLCECGSPKPPGAECCDHCAYLDGIDSRTDNLARVVHVLRGSDGMTLHEICEALGMDTSIRNGRRSVWRWVKTLLERGRIRRYWSESSVDVGEEAESFRNGKSKKEHAVGAWAYVLDGQTAEEWKRNYIVRWAAYRLYWLDKLAAPMQAAA